MSLAAVPADVGAVLPGRLLTLEIEALRTGLWTICLGACEASGHRQRRLAGRPHLVGTTKLSQNLEVTVPAKVFADALALPREVRVELAQALLRSVDGEREGAAESDAGWQGELEERAQRISEGTAELTSWSEAKPAILGELRARREARDR